MSYMKGYSGDEEVPLQGDALDRHLKRKDEEAKLIEHMLSEVEASLEHRGRENAFIESLREQFDDRRSLSEKQVQALKNFYERLD